MVKPAASWREQNKKYEGLGEVGDVLSWTRIHAPMDSYYVVLVKFESGRRQIGQAVLNGGNLKTGSKVRGILRRISVSGSGGLIDYGVKFLLIR